MTKRVLDGAAVHLGDCLDVAADYPDGRFSLLLTSTPYPMQAGFKIDVPTYFDWWRRRLSRWVPKLTADGVVVQVLAFKRDGDWFDTRIFALPHHIEQWGLGLRCVNAFPWDKLNSPPTSDGSRHDRNEYEFCFAFAKSADYINNPQRKPYNPKTIGKAKNGRQRSSDVRGSHDGGHSKLHPDGALVSNVIRLSPNDGKRPRVKGGVFPRKLAARFIRQFSNEGDWIVDTCCGSGTVLTVGRQLGRRVVGVDKDETAFRTAVSWLQAERRPLLEKSK